MQTYKISSKLELFAKKRSRVCRDDSWTNGLWFRHKFRYTFEEDHWKHRESIEKSHDTIHALSPKLV